MDDTIGPLQRKNLAAIAKVLIQISSGVAFDNEEISLVPLNDFVATAGAQMAAWFLKRVF